MTPQDLLKHFGTQAEVARFFGVHPVSVNQWFKDGKVPIGRQYEAFVKTGGQLVVRRAGDTVAA